VRPCRKQRIVAPTRAANNDHDPLRSPALAKASPSSADSRPRSSSASPRSGPGPAPSPAGPPDGSRPASPVDVLGRSPASHGANGAAKLGRQPAPLLVPPPEADGPAPLAAPLGSPAAGLELVAPRPTQQVSPVARKASPKEILADVFPPPGATARRSARHPVDADGSAASDEDTMMKAMRRKAAKNLDFSGMDSSSSSFIPLSTHVLSSKLNSVGISLGKNSSEISVSANVLRRMEFDV
jgi:hypothetical protein